MFGQQSSNTASVTARSYGGDVSASVRSSPAPPLNWAAGYYPSPVSDDRNPWEAGEYNQAVHRHREWYPEAGAYMPHTAPLIYERPATSMAQYPRITLQGPHENWPRSSSQPNTRTSRAAEARRPATIDTHLWPPARPSTLRQSRSESAFKDEADFQLFVAATSGLSPEHSRRNSSSSSGGPREEPEQFPNEEETPRTMYALSQFAQLPQPAPPPLRRSVTDVPHRGRDHDDFISHPDTSNYQDDVLPDYAQSQAEMQDLARQEAKRRAEDLKRRWREGRGW